jgi:hypothetical protein
MTQEQFDRMRFEALPLINFVGGPLDGQHRVPPEANSTQLVDGHPEGRYEFFAGQYFWVIRA